MRYHIFQHRAVHILLVIIAGCLAYSNTFHVPFSFDDRAVIVDNPIVKDFRSFTDPSSLKHLEGHFEYHTFRSRYVAYLTFALNYALHGFDVAGYHAFNLVIHIGTAVLLYFFVLLSFRTPFLGESSLRKYERHIALFAALLFVAHPVQTEAVTYIWQRVASLAALFYVAALILYVQWRLRSFQTVSPRSRVASAGFYLASLACTVLAMKTKQTAFTIPLMMVLYEFMFFRGRPVRRVMFLVPFLLTMLIIPLTLIDIDQPAGDLIGDVNAATRDLSELSRADYLFTEMRVITTYIRLIFLPVNQNLDYDYPVFGSMVNPEVLMSFLFLAAVSGFAVYLMIRSRHASQHLRLAAFGILWFFTALSVESSLIPIANVICEYRVYLPSIGMFVAIVLLVFAGVEKMSARWKNACTAAVVFLALTAVVLAGASYARNTVWRDGITLWKDVVSKSPEKPRAHHNLAMAYHSEGRIQEAITHYRKAIELDPFFYMPYSNLGSAYKSLGLTGRAIEQYRLSLMIKPDDPVTLYNLGNAYMSTGMMGKAAESYREALRLRPDFTNALINLRIAAGASRGR